jgi:hypothetical protein
MQVEYGHEPVMNRLVNLVCVVVTCAATLFAACGSEPHHPPIAQDPPHPPVAADAETPIAPDAKPSVAAAPREDLEVVVEKLLAILSTSKLTFVRNGSDHTGVEASAHIRSKYEGARDAIKTPEDFIEKAASRSSLTGKPYLVKFADGTTQPLGAWLTERLAELRAAR